MNDVTLRRGIIVVILLLVLEMISLAVSFFGSLSLMEGFRIVFGGLYVLFLPGFILTFVFFGKGIDRIERIALSFALSIAVVPLVVFYLNLVGIKMGAASTFLEILAIVLVSLLALYLKR